MHIWIHDKSVQYHQRQTGSMAEKNCFDVTKLFFQVMCVTVVQWSRSCLHLQINRVRLPATLFPVSLYLFFFFWRFFSLFLMLVMHLDQCWYFFVPFFFLFFFLFGLFLTLFFLLAFFLYFYCWPCWSCTWINIYFKRKSGVFREKGFQKPALDLHTGQPYDQKKTISCQDMSLLWNSWIFFNFS